MHDQCIEVNDIESGTYWLRLTANPNTAIEEIGKNGSSQAKIKINLDKEKEGSVYIGD